MDIKALDQALIQIAEKKNQLSGLSYNDQQYDKIEEELHDLEDDLVDKYGSYLEDALHLVHDEICPDNDVLLPTAYLAHKYKKKANAEGKEEFDAEASEGVIVDVDDYPGKTSRLVLIPSPPRLVLTVEKTTREVVWTAK